MAEGGKEGQGRGPVTAAPQGEKLFFLVILNTGKDLNRWKNTRFFASLRMTNSHF